jgi:hypothetical protein
VTLCVGLRSHGVLRSCPISQPEYFTGTNGTIVVAWKGVTSVASIAMVYVTVVSDTDGTAVLELLVAHPAIPVGNITFTASQLPLQTPLRAQVTMVPAVGPAASASSLSTVLVDVQPVACEDCTATASVKLSPGFNALPGYPENVTAAVQITVQGLHASSPLASAEYTLMEVGRNGSEDVDIASGVDAVVQVQSSSAVLVTLPRVVVHPDTTLRVVLVVVSASGTRSLPITSSDFVADTDAVGHTCCRGACAGGRGLWVMTCVTWLCGK